MPDMKLQIEGVKELRHQLDALSKVEERGALRKALRAGANIIRDEARKRVPIRTGILRRNIVTVITVRAKKVEAMVKLRNQGFYGLYLELGSSRMSARPFLRPAADASDEKVSAVIADILGDEIDKIVHETAVL